ncbi:hypothetical protein [Streptomyces gibsoniae]|uniref:Secreted protein n=1 Tax=Streptomyces gibsoniae TaxID=3075529 RepID=A0ABU2TLI0_9ACTN|nr:hypothetical protein [Streptomyces sp. DSM 41699]MDT0461796.1 hypothetical protein [Streptomyces sp. DSM 41699]
MRRLARTVLFRRTEALPVVTLPAALPFAGAALRVMRAAAGRRALHLAVLVGGLFALGLLCEGQAHAADGTLAAATSPTASTATRAPAHAETRRPVQQTVLPIEGAVSSMVGRAVRQGSPLAHPSTSATHVTPNTGCTSATRPTPNTGRTPVARRMPSTGPTSTARPASSTGPAPTLRPAPTALGALADPVTHVTHVTRVTSVTRVVSTMVRPVEDTLVRTVSEGLADAPSPRLSLPTVSSLPSLPVLPSAPSLPSVPGLPALPELPGLPGETGLSGVPVASTPSGHTVSGPSVADRASGEAEHHRAGERREAGPQAVEVDGAAGRYAHRALRLPRTAHAPLHQSPGDAPSGVSGTQPVGDDGAPRHSDGHAVALILRAPLRLLPGSTAVVTADGTRDRHRDIPEFPG